MYFVKAPNDCGFVAYGCVDRIRGIPALRACFNDAVRQTTVVLPFSKSNKIFFGYFDPESIFLDNEIKYFLG